MPDLLAGETILAQDTPPMNSDREDASYGANNTTYGTGSIVTGTYADCACTFTAGTSGRAVALFSARMANSGTGQCYVSVEIRAGSTIGSGSIVQAADDALAATQIGTTGMRIGTSVPISGLTPGNVYNARLLHKVNSGTGTFLYRTLIILPTT